MKVPRDEGPGRCPHELNRCYLTGRNADRGECVAVTVRAAFSLKFATQQPLRPEQRQPAAMAPRGAFRRGSAVAAAVW